MQHLSQSFVHEITSLNVFMKHVPIIISVKFDTVNLFRCSGEFSPGANITNILKNNFLDSYMSLDRMYNWIKMRLYHKGCSVV